MKKFMYFLFLLVACQSSDSSKNNSSLVKNQFAETSIVVLGTAQDAGAPQIGCMKECCIHLHQKPALHHMVVCLGLIDPKAHKAFIVEATPDLPQQMALLKEYCSFPYSGIPDGILLSHAHIGHYTGLMYLGKEAMNALELPVFVMPRMNQFLRNNGPWNQLVKNQNIRLSGLKHQSPVQLSPKLTVTPFIVPHRDEYSETIGFIISGPKKKALFIPDIDKWEKWELNIVKLIKKVDYAFLDATFFNGNELPNRDMSEIPHPFVVESLELFKNLPSIEKNKIHFIHLNHSNPLLVDSSQEYKSLVDQGYHVAKKGDVFGL